MSTAIMLSLKPNQVHQLESGELTLLARKTKPKLQTPFKVIVYQCHSDMKEWDEKDGTVVGEFICDRIYLIDKDSTDYCFRNPIFQTVDNEFFVYKSEAKEKYGLDVCMTDEELKQYLCRRVGYGWHITDVKFYGKPQFLSNYCKSAEMGSWSVKKHVQNPPASWMYVDV